MQLDTLLEVSLGQPLGQCRAVPVCLGAGAPLERLAAATGETTGRWPWPNLGRQQSLSHTFRNFILGGFADGAPVLVTAQGTYEDMHLQGRRVGGELRWETSIPADASGARGS